MRRIGTPLGLFVLALAVRALPWRSTFGEDRVFLRGADPYYHMRRILYTLERFPESLTFDPYLNFPDGGQAHWTPIFDLAVAYLIYPFTREAETAEQIAVWIPPVLGAATVVALYRLALRHFGAKVALVAAISLTFLLAHFWYSQIGFVDHHVAIALASTLLLGSSMNLLRRFEESDVVTRQARRAAVATGFWLSACLLIWTGSLLHVGVVQVALGFAMFAQERRDRALDFAALFAVVQATALVCILPFTWRASSGIDPVRLSMFQPALFGAGALAAAGCAALWRNTAAGETRARRLAAIAFVAAVFGGSAIYSFPEHAGTVWNAWGWFSVDSGFQSRVVESRSIFFDGDGIGFERTEFLLSYFVYVFAIAWAGALGWAWSRRPRGHLFLFLGWTAILAAATVVQVRFMNSLSPAFALVMGWTLARIHAWGVAHLRSPWARRLALPASLALVWAALFQPMFPTYRHHVMNLVAPLRGKGVTVTRVTARNRVLVDLGDWMRRNTPPTHGYRDATQQPEYGVLAAWSLGHTLRYASRRPVVRDNFGTHFAVGPRYFSGDEAEASALLEEMKSRYVVVSPHAAAEMPEVPAMSMYRSLYDHDGTVGVTSGREVAALSRHRLVYETARFLDPTLDEEVNFKVFEHVAGALVAGRAPPGTWVGARLPLRTNQGRRLTYRTRARADDEGRYALRLPYANRGGPPQTHIHSRYTLHCHSEGSQVVIDESHVQGGEEVAGPDLCL